MARRILLVGGDEFRPACATMDRDLLALTGRPQPRVAIIPTAAALENPQRAADNGVRHFAELGAAAYSINATQRQDAESAGVAAQAAGADVIYFTGGSPEHLRSALVDSALLAAVVVANDGGAIWAGSSAGAMVLGEAMRRPAAGAPVAPGLGILPGIMVLPHHERSDPEATAAQLAGVIAADLIAVGIDGATGILLEPEGATALGAGSVILYRAGGWERYAAGDAAPGLTSAGVRAGLV